MKKINFVFIILSLSSQVFAGGSDSGGAGFQRATPEQVRKIFYGEHSFNVKKAVLITAQLLRTHIHSAADMKMSAELKSALEVTLNSTKWGHDTSFEEDVEHSNYYLKPKGLCKYGVNKYNEGSTKIHQPKSPICFSLDALTQLPIQAIPQQLVAIAIHEHAHHFAIGNSESDEIIGNDIQTFVLQSFLNLSMHTKWFDYKYKTSYSMGDSEWLLDLFKNKFSFACLKIGEIRSQFKDFLMQIEVDTTDIQKQLLLTMVSETSKIPEEESVLNVLKKLEPLADICEHDKQLPKTKGSEVLDLEKALIDYWKEI